MPFQNPNQRKAFFEKQKNNNPFGSPGKPGMTMQPSTNTPPPQPIQQLAKIPGVPKQPKFGRIRKMFKI